MERDDAKKEREREREKATRDENGGIEIVEDFVGASQ